MSSRVNLDRPQPYLAEPLELLLATETETPDDHIIKNFDGDFKVVIPTYVADVTLEVRLRARKSSRDGTDVAATDWITSKTYTGVCEKIVPLSRNCEYRFTTTGVGSSVFVTDAQWGRII